MSTENNDAQVSTDNEDESAVSQDKNKQDEEAGAVENKDTENPNAEGTHESGKSG